MCVRPTKEQCTHRKRPPASIPRSSLYRTPNMRSLYPGQHRNSSTGLFVSCSKACLNKHCELDGSLMPAAVLAAAFLSRRTPPAPHNEVKHALRHYNRANAETSSYFRSRSIDTFIHPGCVVREIASRTRSPCSRTSPHACKPNKHTRANMHDHTRIQSQSIGRDGLLLSNHYRLATHHHHHHHHRHNHNHNHQQQPPTPRATDLRGWEDHVPEPLQQPGQ
jgi:hypothetical protein